MSENKNPKPDFLQELLGGRYVGGTLSQLASYADLFKRMPDAVFLLERHSFRVLECNPQASVLLGLAEEEILGRELPVLLQADAFLKSKLQGAFDRSEIEFQGVGKKHQIFEISATQLKILDYIEVIQFIAKDVTAVRQAERELKEANEALLALSTTDEMTGLKNYRYFKEILKSVHHQAQNFGHEYGIIFIDVDHFKKFNDRNGHPAGDEVLRSVARILKDTSRPQDLPARYGGEEFVVLCRDSGEAETRLQAEVIRARIQSHDFPFGEFQPLGRVTASIGVASFPESAKLPEEVLQGADQALYQSKEGGRNQVTAFSGIKKAA